MDTIIRLCAGIINVCAILALAWVILGDFYRATGRNDTVETKKTPVSAVTIVIFISVYCVVLVTHAGAAPLNTVCIAAGALISGFGAVFQIVSRVQLGRSWSNQIRIYEHQNLVTTGVYSVIRHPLYATFIIMFFGNSLMYSNWLSALLTAAVFVPMMDFRARQEEKILCEVFDGYPDYMRSTGRLMVKFGGGAHVVSTASSDNGSLTNGGTGVAVKERTDGKPMSVSPVRQPRFWIFYVLAVGLWALALLLPGSLKLIPLLGVTPYLVCGVIVWMLFRDRDKPGMYGVLLGTFTPFMGEFAVISTCLLLDIPWY